MAGRAHLRVDRAKRRYRGLPVLGGVIVALALVGAAVSPASAASGAPAKPAAQPATRAIDYHGYRVHVPASWPVYNLAADPSRCVLFNSHAVYLGAPGASQHCPARAFGRTEALLIQPASAAGKAQARAAMATDATGHVIQVNAPGPGVVVTATYGRNQAMIRGILAGATMTAAAPATAAGKATETPASKASKADQAPATPDATTDLAGLTGSGPGFDTCTAPSVAAMTDWLASPYRVIGTYLGGVNWACSYGNFSASWVSQVAAEGWRFIPIWVGPQAPCSTIQDATLINPPQAAAEGRAEAANAVATAQSFGYGTGTPIYFDMEGYNTSTAGCSQAVLTFLGGWTRGLHAAGYLSGVYSSAASGISDLAGQYANTTYPSPDDIWTADWNLDPVLTDQYVPDGDWVNHQRLHQYTGGHHETWGGVTLDIDSDAIDGSVAGLPAAPQTNDAVAATVPDEVAASRGGTAIVGLTLRGSKDAPGAASWQVTAPAGLTVTPSHGTVSPGTTRVLVFAVSPSASLAPGRYQLPVTLSVGGNTVAETFELVSVTPPGTTLPTASPVVLYAADQQNMAVAAATARELALPAGDVTGSFSQAWTDLTSGKNLLLAVGQAAVNALYYNTCGWANPAGEAAGSTPFYYPGEPAGGPPGVDAFELSDGTGVISTALLTSQLTQYALAGTLPDYGKPPLGPAQPTNTCLGSADVTAG